MQTVSRERQRAVAKVVAYLSKHDFPRLQMATMVLLTAGAGFLCSVILLRSGVGTMWLRYATATVVAYIIFLGCLWVWVTLKKRQLNVSLADGIDFLPDSLPRGPLPSIRDKFTPSGGRFGGGGASAHFESSTSGTPDFTPEPVSATHADSGISLDVPLDIDEPVIIALLAAAIAALVAVVVSIYYVYIAPSLYAELLLDGALSAALYRRICRLDRNHWMETALKKTWIAVVILVLFFTGAGWVIQHYVPDVDSLGQLIRKMQG